MKYISFNLNYNVYVKLRLEGFQAWKTFDDDQLKQCLATFPALTWKSRPLEYYISQADEEGFVAIQGWKFIQIFGPVTNIGQLYFATDVRIKAAETALVTK